MELYINPDYVDGMANEFKKWMETNHPEITPVIDNSAGGVILINEDGNAVNHNLWEDFCND